MKFAYYNEIDPHAAAWLRELIKSGLIADGEVDERSIADVEPKDLAGFTRCHFFAGIGGWDYALSLAEWGDRPAWTGSCPCQPYSVAGKQKGNADERNLWPEFFRLISQCRPDVVFGEQVPAAIKHGWLDGISTDLEGAGYACGAVVLGAHSAGAPHIRQRLFWVADAENNRTSNHIRTGRNEPDVLRGCTNRRLADANGAGLGPQSINGRDDTEHHAEPCREFDRLEHAASDGRQQRRAEPSGGSVAGGCSGSGLGNSGCTGPQERGDSERGAADVQRQAIERTMPWSDYILIPCRDGKARRAEPGIEPLANGVSGRVAQLRGLGNAIVPQVAAEFIQAYQATRTEGVIAQ